MAAVWSCNASRRLPSLFRHIRRNATTSTYTSTFTSTSRSAKVSDRIVRLSVVDPVGRRHVVLGLTGHTLLRTLCNAGLMDPESHRLDDIEACSAECEVSIAEEWLQKLPPRSYEESYILQRYSRARTLNPHSRLGCQVILTHDLQGMVVAIPEPKPWDTS